VELTDRTLPGGVISDFARRIGTADVDRGRILADVGIARTLFGVRNAAAYQCLGFAADIEWYAANIAAGWFFLLLGDIRALAAGGPMSRYIESMAAKCGWNLVFVQLPGILGLDSPPPGWSFGPTFVRADVAQQLSRPSAPRNARVRDAAASDIDFLLANAGESLFRGLSAAERCFVDGINYPHLAAQVLAARTKILVAECGQDSQLCGYALVDDTAPPGQYVRNAGFLHDVDVVKSRHSQGVGAALTRAACERAAAAGVQTLYSTVMHPDKTLHDRILSQIGASGWRVESAMLVQALGRL
jgi:hypothetical protein